MAKVEYRQLLEEGAFPNQIDPWAEKGEFFHPIHGQMISIFLQVLREPLRNLGYRIGREPSLQIASGFSNLPDIAVRVSRNESVKRLDYRQELVVTDIDFGTLVEKQIPDLDRLFIKSIGDNKLVTVVELISPNNKTKLSEMEHYITRRDAIIEQAVHCVEIDLTRSVKRLIDYHEVHEFPYHMAVHLNDGEMYFVGTKQNEMPKTLGLPLQSEIIHVEIGEIYRQAYIETAMAEEILDTSAYSEAYLPFPSLLSEDERKGLLAQVEAWKAKLKEAGS